MGVILLQPVPPPRQAIHAPKDASECQRSDDPIDVQPSHGVLVSRARYVPINEEVPPPKLQAIMACDVNPIAAGPSTEAGIAR